MKSQSCLVAVGIATAAAALSMTLPMDGVRAASFCSEPPEAATVEVSAAPPEIEFDHSLSKRELARLAAEEYGHVHAEGSAVFGLTAGRVHARLSVHSLTEKRSGGQRCGWPSRVVATVGFDGPIAVHVAREYARGSCQHKAILDHEMEHVAVLEGAIADYEQRLRKALQRALDKGRFPFTGQDTKKVQAKVERHFEAAFKDAVAAAERERDRLNALIDTPESYRRTRDRCRSW